MSSKAKVKRDRIREETQRLNAKRSSLNESCAIENLIELVPIFRQFNKGELKAQIRSFNKIPEEYEDWAFSLVKGNMKKLYEDAFGWNEEAKEADFYHENSRFLIAFYDEHPIGFIHFRFELEGGESSLFIYDFHVEHELQRKGLGKFLVQAVEFMGLKLKFDSIMVSLLKDNVVARAFFRKLQYVQHPTSPIMADPENDHEYHHEILFKQLKKN